MTPQTLIAATGCTPARSATYAPLLAEVFQRYSINTPQRQARFLAQVGHESLGLLYTRELWGPTPAQVRYEGRVDLGNTRPGDGKRYMGRGLIQTTGRANYRNLTTRLRAAPDLTAVPDFEAAPELLEQPRWAALSAGDFWAMKSLNAIADSGDFVLLTKRINGGTNGLADREERLKRACAALGVA